MVWAATGCRRRRRRRHREDPVLPVMEAAPPPEASAKALEWATPAVRARRTLIGVPLAPPAQFADVGDLLLLHRGLSPNSGQVSPGGLGSGPPLLNGAHPESLIAHELDAVGYVEHHFGRDQLYALLLERDEVFASMGRKWMGYDYVVPHQFQGRWSKLRVIGDKRGHVSTSRLARHPETLDRLRHLVGVPIRVVHVTRNPYDNVATMARPGAGAREGGGCKAPPSAADLANWDDRALRRAVSGGGGHPASPVGPRGAWCDIVSWPRTFYDCGFNVHGQIAGGPVPVPRGWSPKATPTSPTAPGWSVALLSNGSVWARDDGPSGRRRGYSNRPGLGGQWRDRPGNRRHHLAGYATGKIVDGERRASEQRLRRPRTERPVRLAGDVLVPTRIAGGPFTFVTSTAVEQWRPTEVKRC